MAAKILTDMLVGEDLREATMDANDVNDVDPEKTIVANPPAKVCAETAYFCWSAAQDL